MNDEESGYLVLTRNVGEAIKIGSDISITVARVDRGQVRLAIRAPKSLTIVRAELARADTEQQL